MDRRGVCLARAGCLVVLAWLSALACKAQDDVAVTTARSELAHFSTPLRIDVQAERAALEKPRRNLWLLSAASASVAFGASFAFTEAFAARNASIATRELRYAKNLSLGMDVRANAQRQGLAAEAKADLMRRVSDICLAGTVAATGATLLIWLTSKQERMPHQNRTLVGPMVLRGMNGAGLVLREKF
ncbi:MAG: hypothetical protein ABW252_12885 [Polyangiales bacterium]